MVHFLAAEKKKEKERIGSEKKKDYGLKREIHQEGNLGLGALNAGSVAVAIIVLVRVIGISSVGVCSIVLHIALLKSAVVHKLGLHGCSSTLRKQRLKRLFHATKEKICSLVSTDVIEHT